MAGAPTLYSGDDVSMRDPHCKVVPTLYSGDDVSMRDPHCKVVLSGRTSHIRVENISLFVLNWICRVGMVI